MTMPDMSRRRFLALGAAGVAGLALAACGGDDGDGGAAATSTTTKGEDAVKDFGGKTITTAVYAKNHASSPLLWQQFAPPGLTVTPVIFTSAGDISRALANGDLDFGLMGPYNTLIEASTTGMQSRIIGMCSRQGIGLIARKDRGITKPEDLAGKKVAVPPPGVQILALTAALDKVGLKLDRDVQSVPLGYADHPGVLERGDVDAYIGTEPLCTQSVAAGVGVRFRRSTTRLWATSTPPCGPRPRTWPTPTCFGPWRRCSGTRRSSSPRTARTPRPSGTSCWSTSSGTPRTVYEAVLENIGAVWGFDDEPQDAVRGGGGPDAEPGRDHDEAGHRRAACCWTTSPPAERRRAPVGPRSCWCPGCCSAPGCRRPPRATSPRGSYPEPAAVASSAQDFLFGDARPPIPGVVPFAGAASEHITASLRRWAVAYLLAIAIGAPLGLGLGLSRWFAASLDPLVQAIRSVPITAWLPIALVWFGLGEGAARFLVFIGAVFPIVVATADATARACPVRWWTRPACSAPPGGPWPGASTCRRRCPGIVTGLRLGLTLGWTSVIIGELTGTSRGLGAMMFAAREVGRLDQILVGMAAFAIIGLAGDLLLRALTRPLVAWADR